MEEIMPQIEVASLGQIPCHIVKKHTLLVGLKDILPEDLLWRKDNPRTPAVICLEEEHACTCPYNCMVKLAHRCHALFSQNPLTQIFILFRREEKDLIRRKPKKEIIKSAGVAGVKTKVPRILAIHVPDDYQLRLMRVNYDGLNLVMQGAEPIRCDLSTIL
jgi:hypothetical protein